MGSFPALTRPGLCDTTSSETRTARGSGGVRLPVPVLREALDLEAEGNLQMMIEAAVRVLNDLEAQGIIETYAIGGGMAGAVYAEPIVTYDLDAFVLVRPAKGNLVSLRSIYEYLRGKGHEEDKEHVVIGDVPVQFIPAYNRLTEEAVRDAVELPYKGLRMRVFRIEHLIAIMLQTGRAKDRVKLVQLLDHGEPDADHLDEVLRRHRLTGK